MYGPEILNLFDLLGPIFFRGHCTIIGSRWLPARPFFAMPLYPWFQLVFPWRHRHYVVADCGVIRGSLMSVVLAGVPLTSRKLHRSRRQSHPPQRRIPYSGGCSRHVTDITFNRAAGPSATALYPSFQLMFWWPTENHVLADDSCAFLLQVCCAVGNANDTLGRERNPCVYNWEPHQTGRKWLRNCNYTNNVKPIQPLSLHAISNICFRNFLFRATPDTPASYILKWNGTDPCESRILTSTFFKTCYWHILYHNI